MSDIVDSKQEYETSNLELPAPPEGLDSNEQLDWVIRQLGNQEDDGKLQMRTRTLTPGIKIGPETSLKKIYTYQDMTLSKGDYGVSNGHGGCPAEIITYKDTNGESKVHVSHIYKQPGCAAVAPQRIRAGGGIIDRIYYATRSSWDQNDGKAELQDTGFAPDMIQTVVVDPSSLVNQNRAISQKKGIDTYRVWVHMDERGKTAIKLTTDNYSNKALSVQFD
jgi:hypothetical protein